MTGARLCEGQVSLSVTGAVVGEGQVALFVTGAILGEGRVSLFVTGAVLGEGLWWCSCVFESSEQGCSIKVVTNHSIGTCSVDLYILYLFETSGTASCGTTGIK